MRLLVGTQTWNTVILNGLPWKRIEIILSFLRLHPSNVFWTLLLTMMVTPFLQRDSCSQLQMQWSSELNSPIPVHFSSPIPKMLMFTLCHLLFDHFKFVLIHGLNIPGSYAILLFTASNLTSITSHIHNWALFLLWLCLVFLSGVISPVFSSSILEYQPGEFIFQCHSIMNS